MKYWYIGMLDLGITKVCQTYLDPEYNIKDTSIWHKAM